MMLDINNYLEDMDLIEILIDEENKNKYELKSIDFNKDHHDCFSFFIQFNVKGEVNNKIIKESDDFRANLKYKIYSSDIENSVYISFLYS